jgi:hypothetical protein
MHPLRLPTVLREDHEDVVEEMTDEAVRQEVDDHDEVDDKNEQSQSLNKKS